MPRARRVVAVTLAGALLLGACGKPAAGTSTQPEPVPATSTSERPQRSLPRYDPSVPGVAVGTQGAVTSAEANASKVGIEILQQGGNAVDAAVAVAFALAVTHPSAGNLGGGGFMVIHTKAGENHAIDYREKAPMAAHRDMFLDEAGEPTRDRLIGAKAAGIPGTVAGMALAHEKFGRLSWKDVVWPAVVLAEQGHEIDSWHAEDLQRGVEWMREAGFDASAAYYADAEGKPLAAGARWVQPELADTLERIAEQGPRAFYEGPIAERLVSGVTQAGGIWSLQDLAQYEAVEREPIVFEYRGNQIVTMPPPSAGGIVLRQILGAAEHLELYALPWRSVPEVHAFVEVARRAYADRNLLLGDPDFVENPLEKLLSPDYFTRRMQRIDMTKATPSTEIDAGLPVGKDESFETTHFSVIDRDGNAVSNTYTLNLGFGARYVVPGTGVLLNNEMDDFSVKPGTANVFGLVQGEQNAIAPGKRMLSSMTPTIVLREGEVRAVVGSPGGPTITTTVAQVVRALLDYDMTIDKAVASVRVHHQWLPDTIWTEERMPQDLADGLAALGHIVLRRGAIGHANCIEVDPKTSGFRAVADVTRDGGKAMAY